MKNQDESRSRALGPVVLAFGDSLTAGYGLRADQSFAAELERRLRPRFADIQVINAGLSGDTTATAMARLPKLLSRLTVRPDLAIVELGANDLIRGVPLARIGANLDEIIADLRRMAIPVLLARMEAPAFLGAFSEACGRIYTDLAARHGIECHPFLPPNLLGNPSLCLPDRLHPNAAGVRAIADGITPAVVAALDRSDRDAA